MRMQIKLLLCFTLVIAIFPTLFIGCKKNKSDVSVEDKKISSNFKLAKRSITSGEECYGIISYIGSDKDVVIPNTYKGLPVYVIQSGAFSNSSIEKVTIGKNLKTISDRAFEYSRDLEQVVFESGSLLETISQHAFDGCRDLTSISIPAQTTKIESYAFNGCTSMSTLTINFNNTNKTIAGDAFKLCSSVSTIYVYGVDASATNVFCNDIASTHFPLYRTGIHLKVKCENISSHLTQLNSYGFASVEIL